MVGVFLSYLVMVVGLSFELLDKWVGLYAGGGKAVDFGLLIYWVLDVAAPFPVKSSPQSSPFPVRGFYGYGYDYDYYWTA